MIPFEHPSVATIQITNADPVHLLDPERFSSWNKTARTAAWVIRSHRNSKQSKLSSQKTTGTNGSITANEYAEAQRILIHQLQASIAPEEMEKWNFIQAENAIRRCQGRLSATSLQPIHLPRNHPSPNSLFSPVTKIFFKAVRQQR